MARTKATPASEPAPRSRKKAATAPKEPTEPKPKIKLPKSVAEAADRLYTLREDKRVAKKVVDAIEAEESAVREYIIEHLPRSNATGISGKIANAKIVEDSVPRVADWDKFYEYIRKNKAFELIQRRLAEGAVKERWEAKKVVPGVEAFIVKKVSVTKVG